MVLGGVGAQRGGAASVHSALPKQGAQVPKERVAVDTGRPVHVGAAAALGGPSTCTFTVSPTPAVHSLTVAPKLLSEKHSPV